MAGPLRIEYPGAVYHITSRGNAQARIFLKSEDRNNFISILSDTNERYNWLCHKLITVKVEEYACSCDKILQPSGKKDDIHIQFRGKPFTAPLWFNSSGPIRHHLEYLIRIPDYLTTMLNIIIDFVSIIPFNILYFVTR